MTRTARILIPDEKSLREAAHDFHTMRVGEFLLPRLITDFDQFAKDRELWVATIGSEIVATCYVTREDDAKEAEFGGIIVRDDHEGKSGLGTAIGIVAISAHFLHDASPVIAHVHVENPKPLPLLTKRLGFTQRAGEPGEYKKADFEKRLGRSIDMKHDDGIIRGHTFDFSRSQLEVFADRLETAKLAKIKIDVENAYFRPDMLKESVKHLRALADAKP